MDTPNGPTTARQHTASAALLEFFDYGHLPDDLARVAREFQTLADWLADNLPAGAEATAGLRKLLEAKDCAVRAVVAGRHA